MKYYIRDSNTMRYLIDPSRIAHPYSWSKHKDDAKLFNISEIDRIIANNPRSSFFKEIANV